MALDRIAERHGLGPWKKRFHGLVCDGPIGGRRVMLLKPQTYMNDSGQAVGEAQRYLKIAEGDIFVFHDELDLAPAKLKVKAGGGNAGHNGLRSISAHIGNEYARVRIGIGHPGSKDLVQRLRAARLRQGRRGLARAAARCDRRRRGRLAAGDDARFLTDVARALQPPKASATDGRSAEARRAQAGLEPAASRRRAAHPAGERQSKRGERAGREPQEVAARAARDLNSKRPIHGLQMRHRGPAERRQVHPLQRADADGGGGGGQLSLLHHRAQRRRRRRARSAARQAARRSASRPSTIPTRLTFVDIAGLVRGASKGEGLGNQFLGHIREVDAVAYVLRCFEDPDITHVEGRIDPVSDAETVETELMLADLDSLERRRDPLAKKANSGDKEAKAAGRADRQGAGAGARRQAGAHGQADARGGAPLPAAAAADRQARGLRVQRRRGLHRRQRHCPSKVEERAKAEGAGCVVISAKIEAELAGLEPEERAEYLEQLGLEEPGLNALIREGYRVLDLITFFTVGPKEARAWTVHAGTKAPKAAGAIHTDFEKGFIRAETIAYDDFVALGGELPAKEAGKMRLEGKEYVVKDGDVMLFRFAN